MGSSKERKSAKQNKGGGINRFLLIARVTALSVSSVMALFRIEPSTGPFSIPVALGILVVYNLAAGAVGFALRAKHSRTPWIVTGADIIAASVIIGATGAYNSAFFAMLLFVMVETSLHFNWRIASGVIVTINAAQVIATAVHVATHGNSGSFYPLESRFLLVLVVGFLFVILSENMRREERAREAADRVSAQTAKLNSIFAQMGHAHLNIVRVFETVFAAAESVGAVLFSAILQRSEPREVWTVVASSKAELCPTGRNLFGGEAPVQGANRPLAPRILTGEQLETCGLCAIPAVCRQLIICNMPAYSETEEGMLVIARSDSSALGREDVTFVQALSMEAQLAIHNALLYRRQEKQFERLKAFNEMQDAFFSAAAHDLKTPLTVLSVLASTLRMTIAGPSPEQVEMLATIEQNVRRLQTYTDNMLAAARLEADDVVLHRKSVDPKSVALHSAEVLKSVLVDKEIDVALEPQSAWRGVEADPDRLGEVFGNLLSNAAKFAPQRSQVTIRFRSDENREVFSVCNQGPPVPENERERVFERAYTGKDAGTRAGSGLGLYIVKKLVALHGGSVWVDVTPDSVCFRFTLPRVGGGEAA